MHIGIRLGIPSGGGAPAELHALLAMAGFDYVWVATKGLEDDGDAFPDDEEEVEDWIDQNGGRILRQTTATRLPTYEANATNFGGKGAVDFDGTNDDLTSTGAASTWKFATDGSGATIMCLTDDTSGESGVLGLWNIGGPFANSRIGVWLARVNGTIAVRVANGSGANWSFNKTAAIPDGVSLWTVTLDATGVTTRRNGAEVASLSGTYDNAVSSGDPSSTLELGAGIDTTYPWNGLVSALCIAESALSASQIAAAEGAVAAYYGVPLA